MKIEHRSDGNYRVRKMVDGRKYTLNFDHSPTKSEIQKAFADKIALQGNNLPLKGTFGDYSKKYISVKENVLSPSTVCGYVSIDRNMPEWFMSLSMDNISQEDVQKLISKYSANHSAKSVYNLHGYVTSVLKMYRPLLNLNTTLPPKKKQEIYEPTDEDIKRILALAEGTEYEIIFNLLVYGLRRSEAIAIDVNTDLFNRKEKTTTLTINKAKVRNKEQQFIIKDTNKTYDSTRTIEIANALADKIIASGKVYDGAPDQINKVLTRYQKQLGIPHFRLHQFRHYYASMMLSLGVPITFVESSGGWKHGSSSLRNVYTYTQELRLKEEQEKGVDYISSLLS